MAGGCKGGGVDKRRVGSPVNPPFHCKTCWGLKVRVPMPRNSQGPPKVRITTLSRATASRAAH